MANIKVGEGLKRKNILKGEKITIKTVLKDNVDLAKQFPKSNIGSGIKKVSKPRPGY